MQLKSSLRLAILASFALGGAAMAQTPPADQQAPTPAPATEAAPAAPVTAPDEATGRKRAEEEIVVTGSRVRRKDLSTPAPVTVISRQQLQTSATPTLGDFLQLLPEQGNATNTQVNNGGDGSTQISLRSLGAQRTLVLLDGRRMVPYAGATVVDINTIPTAVVDHIEVLKDGASAVYGSDAIAGVVNIITRRKVNTTEATAYYGLSQHNDSQVTDVNIVSGATGDKGNFMIGGGYFKQDSMLAANRDWASHALGYDYSYDRTAALSTFSGSEAGVTYGGSSRIPQGRVRINPAGASCTTQVCADLAAKFGAGARNYMYDPTAPNAVDGWRPFTGNDFYNYQAVNFLITPSQRYSLFANGEYHLTDNTRAYFQGTFVNRQSSNLLAPEPFDTAGLGIQVDKTNPYNPFGTNLTSVRKRLVTAAGRSATSDLDTYRLVGGVDGTLPDEFGPLKSFVWDLSFQYGRSVGTVLTNGSVNAIKAAQAIGPAFKDPVTGVYRCGTATNPIPGCVPANLFGLANPTGDQLNSLGFEQLLAQNFSQQTDLNASITGELFQLASDRSVGIAVGYEFRRLFGGLTPDSLATATFTNPNGFNNFVDSDYGTAATRGEYKVNEGYAEVIIPVMNHVPFVDDLEAQAAVRVFNYSTFGTDATYKFGGRYRPIRDVTLRATYSTAFRAPSINELYGGRGPSAESASDPCGPKGIDPNSALGKQCAASAVGAVALSNGDDNVQLNSNVGGFTGLQPEKSTAYTVGAVLEPQMVRGLTVTADYYHINVTNTIQGAGTQNILNACYPGTAGTPDAVLCSQVHRDPVTGMITVVDDYTANLGSLTTAGIDLSARYTMPTTDFGRFGFLLDANYLLQQDQFIFSLIKGAGNFDLGVNPRIKFNAGVNYQLAGLSVGVLGRFIGGYWECPAQDLSNTGGLCSQPVTADNFANNATGPIAPNHRVKPEMTFDVNANYALKHPLGTTTFGIGVRNVFNTNPVRVYNAFLTYADPSAYDFVGRFVYGRISHSF
jgi:outer membrane receptor protein involved in Fe transport